MEKRTYSRVAASISGRFRILSSGDDQPIYSGWSRTSIKDVEQALQQAKLPEAMVQFLANMDAKLDTILGQMQKDTLREDFPFRLQATEISGAGLRFSTTNQLSEHSYVEIVLFLRQYPLIVSSAIGKITRINQQSSVDSAGEYALEFTAIHDNDLEQVIAFVFDQERRLIRQHKWE